MKYIVLILLIMVSACSSQKGFYIDAEKYNRAAGMYCGDKGVRTFMTGNGDIIFIVCKDGTRFTVNGEI